MQKQKQYFETIIQWIKDTKPDKIKLSKEKVKLCREFSMKKIPTDIEIFLNANSDDTKEIRKYIETKPTRTGSGVAVVATMSAPSNCPHGSCIYCPGGLNSEFGDIPKSYTGKEPSTMRGIRNEFDPYRIIFNRLEQYIVLGQNPEKVDQIIMGGTFPSLPIEYQDDYIYYSFKAYNDFSKEFYVWKDVANEETHGKWELDIIKFKKFFELPGDINSPERALRIKNKILALREIDVKTLKEEHLINENVAIRCIGLTIETKPDFGRLEHGKRLLDYGVTRIELGIQTVYDNILKYVHRGHDLQESKDSIAELRDLGFKLNFHIMPGLPVPTGERISREKDIDNFRIFFEDNNFKPDMLKIYPCMVMPGTKLLKDFKSGIFTPLTTKEAADIIVEGFKYIPEWCRVMRVQRDIPTYVTSSGVDKTNLRQYIDILAKERGVVFKDIRTREIKQGTPVESYKLVIREYKANNGTEYFISAEGKDDKDNIKLLGFIRLRLLPRILHEKITKTSSMVRELHVYGSAIGIGKDNIEKTQHKGIGKALVAKAEEISKNNGKDKILIISGVGVRGYYRKL